MKIETVRNVIYVLLSVLIIAFFIFFSFIKKLKDGNRIYVYYYIIETVIFGFIIACGYALYRINLQEQKLNEVKNLFYQMGVNFFKYVYPTPIIFDPEQLAYYTENTNAIVDVFINKLLYEDGHTIDELINEFTLRLKEGTPSKIFNPFEFMELQLYASSIIFRNCIKQNIKIDSNIVKDVQKYVKEIYPSITIRRCPANSTYDCFTDDERNKILSEFGKCGNYIP